MCAQLATMSHSRAGHACARSRRTARKHDPNLDSARRRNTIQQSSEPPTTTTHVDCQSVLMYALTSAYGLAAYRRE